MKEENRERADNFDDEIKPEDGRLRYWMFFNGEEYRLFAALAAAFFGMSGVVYTFLGRGKVFSEPSCLYWRCSVLALAIARPPSAVVPKDRLEKGIIRERKN